jgi:hypothetical protein
MSAMTPTPDLSQGVIAKPARAAPVRWRDGRGLVDGGRVKRLSAGRQVVPLSDEPLVTAPARFLVLLFGWR